MDSRSEIEGIRAVNRAAHSGFVSMDEQGIITWWNPKAEQIFGWTCDEVIGRAVADVLIPEESRAAHWRGLSQFLANGTGPVLDQVIEVEALHRSGHLIPVELTITSLQLHDGWTFHAFLRDIRDRQRADREATAALVGAALAASRAAEYERALADYHSLMRHRIGNPLTVIVGAAMTLRDVTGLDETTREQMLAMIIESARHLQAVTLEASPVTPEEIGLQPRPETREQRLTANEVFFREINAKIAGASEMSARNQLPFVCECSDATCTRVIYMSRDQYETLRASSREFAVAPGHERLEIEDVVDRHARFWTVRKLDT